MKKKELKKKELEKKLNNLDYWVDFANWCLVHHPKIIKEYQNQINQNLEEKG